MNISISPTAASVLRQLISNETVTKPVLQQSLGVSDATAFRAVEELTALGIIQHRATEQTTRGRPASLLAIHDRSFTTIAVSIEEEESVVSLVDAAGDILEQQELDITPTTDYLVVIKQLTEAILAFRSRALLIAPLLSGVGIAFGGSVDATTGTLLQPSRFPLWHHRQLGQDLSLSTGLRCAVDNDVSSMTRTLLWYGNNPDLTDFLLVNCGRGIGLGISINGSVLQGRGNIPAGLAHTAVTSHQGEARRCFCGRENCLELLHSLKAIRAGLGIPATVSDSETLERSKANSSCSSLLAQSAVAIAINALSLARCLDVNTIVAAGVMTITDAFRQSFAATVESDRQNRRGYQHAFFLDELLAHPNPRTLAAAAISLDQVFNERSFLRA